MSNHRPELGCAAMLLALSLALGGVIFLLSRHPLATVSVAVTLTAAFLVIDAKPSN